MCKYASVYARVRMSSVCARMPLCVHAYVCPLCVHVYVCLKDLCVSNGSGLGSPFNLAEQLLLSFMAPGTNDIFRPRASLEKSTIYQCLIMPLNFCVMWVRLDSY